MNNKRLLILDLNGTICHVERIFGKDRPYNIYKRPYLKPFLNYAFANFDVAVWTSREKKNMDIVIDYVFTKFMTEKAHDFSHGMIGHTKQKYI